jgi:hypothetical protein
MGWQKQFERTKKAPRNSGGGQELDLATVPDFTAKRMFLSF